MIGLRLSTVRENNLMKYIMNLVNKLIYRHVYGDHQHYQLYIEINVKDYHQLDGIQEWEKVVLTNL